MSTTTRIFRNVKVLPGSFRNFSGTVGEYNAQISIDSNGNPIGKRYFSIKLTEEMAEELRDLELPGSSGKMIKGCNIKTRLPQNEGDAPSYSMKITFGKIPPEAIWRVVPKGRMALNLETVGNLDNERIDHADVKVIFCTYEKGPNIGITAYLNKLIVYIEEDTFDNDEAFNGIPIIGTGEKSYADVDDGDLPF